MNSTTRQALHQGGPVIPAGSPLNEAQAAMILLHGRGATAASILELAPYFAHPRLAFLAPQAAGQSWYPYSFLSPLAQNEPWLSSALQAVGELVAQVEAAGIPAGRIMLSGFSQGACLAAEFAARQPRRYGGLLLFSGGVIGPAGTPRNYPGSLAGTPVFIGCSDNDSHIPLSRVHETTDVLTRLGAQVNQQIYPQMGHTIIQAEIDQAQALVAGLMNNNQ